MTANNTLPLDRRCTQGNVRCQLEVANGEVHDDESVA